MAGREGGGSAYELPGTGMPGPSLGVRRAAAAAVLCASAVCFVLWRYCALEAWAACAATGWAGDALFYAGAGLLLLVCCAPGLSVMPPQRFFEMAPWLEKSLRRRHEEQAQYD